MKNNVLYFTLYFVTSTRRVIWNKQSICHLQIEVRCYLPTNPYMHTPTHPPDLFRGQTRFAYLPNTTLAIGVALGGVCNSLPTQPAIHTLYPHHRHALVPPSILPLPLPSPTRSLSPSLHLSLSPSLLPSLTRSLTHSFTHSLKHSIDRSNQSITRSLDPSINQSINRWIDQSINQSRWFKNTLSRRNGRPLPSWADNPASNK